VNYIEITKSTREAAKDGSLIAQDGLHLSAKEYERWAQKLAAAIQQQLR
jgi:lysophospholipase L1-like esterase